MPPPLHDSQAEQARPLVRKAAIPTHPSRLTLSPSRLVKHFRTRLLRPITRRVATCTESESFLLMHPTIKQTVCRSSSAALISVRAVRRRSVRRRGVSRASRRVLVTTTIKATSHCSQVHPKRLSTPLPPPRPSLSRLRSSPQRRHLVSQQQLPPCCGWPTSRQPAHQPKLHGHLLSARSPQR